MIRVRDDGIVVLGSEEGNDQMRSSRIPRVLADRLGTEGTEALSTLFDAAHAEWSEEVVTLAAERFERSLSGEISRLRMDISKDLLDIRQDVSRQFAEVREDISGVRVDLFKWSFLFWIGQVAAVGGLLAVMLRFS